jgi:hypothetical protein
VKSYRPSPEEESHVVHFHPRGVPRWRWRSVNIPQEKTPVDDLAKFEQGEGHDDYRQRMRMNALALVATALLVVAGVWLANSISAMVKTQDCYLSGRRNCAPIDAGPTRHGQWAPASIKLALSGNVERDRSKT